MSDTIYVGTIAVKIANSLKMKERAKNDRYATDRKAIRQWRKKAMLGVQFGHIDGQRDEPIQALDTGCGIDARWSEELAIDTFHTDMHHAIDINEDGGSLCSVPRVHIIHSDFLTFNPPKNTYNFLYGNPPFNLANSWLAKSFQLVNTKLGRISYLFPITLAATKQRREMYKEYPISRMLIYSERISFEGYNGGTYPAREYTQFEWWFKDGRCLTPRQLVRFYGIEPIDYLEGGCMLQVGTRVMIVCRDFPANTQGTIVTGPNTPDTQWNWAVKLDGYGTATDTGIYWFSSDELVEIPQCN